MTESILSPEVRRFLESMHGDSHLHELFQIGDNARSEQTCHDEAHGKAVESVAADIVAYIASKAPLQLSDADILSTLASAYLHDIGSVTGADNHHRTGAKLANHYLRRCNADVAIRRRVCLAIALHRTSSVLDNDFAFSDVAHAICVIADKCVGDENRVRPAIKQKLTILAASGQIDQFTGSVHDLVNFSIQEAQVLIDGPDVVSAADMGTIILQIKLREHLDDAAKVYELYDRRFRSCVKASTFLGFAFRLEFNGHRYHLTEGGWTLINPTCFSLE
ncbi:MAG: HD domain-containing protein [Leptolyngbya sp.]|nr:HD domain-containing protein [Candidatus Melainabacteria bacterium]